MMVRSIEGGRWTATFRPQRRVRFLGTCSIALWLCVWAVGEVFAVGVLLASLGLPWGPRLLHALTSLEASLAPGVADRIAWREFPGPPNAGALALAFVGVWLAIWTMAGLLAAYQVLRLLASEDWVAWDGTGVEIRRRVGPFRTRRQWRADQIEHVSLSRSDRALLLHTPRATRTLTPWGSRAERAGVRDEIRKVLGSGAHAAGPEIPSGWSVLAADDEGMLLVRDPGARRARAVAAWSTTIALVAGAVFAWYRGYLAEVPGLGGDALALFALLGLAGCVAGSAWLSFGGTRIVVRKGAIEFRPGPLAGRSTAILEKLTLVVDHTTDDDGDDWFELQARSGQQRRTIDRRMNESRKILQLARWIAEQSGAPLDLGRGVEYGDAESRAAA
jgi:hypothetical protein